MKLLVFFLCCMTSVSAGAQTVYLADTAIITDIGYGGAPSSCKANGPIYNSWGMDRTQSTWLADVFTVPAGDTWVFDTVILFGYQFGSTLTSPFLGCNLEIYNGVPGLGGTVIWGDTSTNVLKSTYFTGIYRVDTIAVNGGLLTNKRPIMYLKLLLSPAPVLSGGTYWLAWSCTADPSLNGPACPPKVLPGRINPSGEMGRYSHGGTWGNTVDNGYSEGFNMIIKAKADLASVPQIGGTTPHMLGQNAPNPFNETTSITIDLQTTENVKVQVYNPLGQTVATVVNGPLNAGIHRLTFDAADLPPGTYYYKLSTSKSSECLSMTIIK